MKLAVISVGQAGGKILDRLLEYDTTRGTNIVTGAVAVNTATADLQGLELVPKANQVLVGQSRVKGNGVGADNELGAEVMTEDLAEVDAAVDTIPTHEVDAFLVVAALGGGTGSGGAPVVASRLKEVYREPVYGLGVLPSPDEGKLYSLNAARSFQTFVREVDNLMVFDNDAWRASGESLEEGYREINRELVQRFGMLFAAGEVGDDGLVGESVVDASEIKNTLDSGGVTTIGYATTELDRDRGLLSRFRRSESVDSTAATNRITGLIRKAALGQLTLPAAVDSTERALVVVGGPPKYLSRAGIEKSRKWIEQETGSLEVRGGDYPTDSEYVAGLVLLSGVTNIPRIKELQALAVEAQDNISELAASREEDLQSLVEDDSDDLEPLF